MARRSCSASLITWRPARENHETSLVWTEWSRKPRSKKPTPRRVTVVSTMSTLAFVAPTAAHLSARERDEGAAAGGGVNAAGGVNADEQSSPSLIKTPAASTPQTGANVNASPSQTTAQTSPSPIPSARATRASGQKGAGPLGEGEGAATGRWLAAGLRAASPRGRLDSLAATLDSVLPSPRARTAVARGRRFAVAPRRARG